MTDVLIVGAGLAGLNCARTLEHAGVDVAVLEAQDAAGGRVRTDAVDGFLLDRGFQVLLTAYPEAERALDYDALRLQCLLPGALVWHGGRFHRFADPFREPLAAMRLALDPVVTLGDKLRVARLRARLQRGSCADLFHRHEEPTAKRLARLGFSPKMIDRFFRPFFGGVFLETGLVTSSRYFEFLFRMFSCGATAVPRTGMQAIPLQLAAGLKPGVLATGARVTGVARDENGFTVEARGRETMRARAVVFAAAQPETRRLLGLLQGAETASAGRMWNPTTTFYFSAEKSPVESPILMLNGEGSSAGPVNNAVVMSAVSSAYAPPGAHLIAASVVGEAPSSDRRLSELEREVRLHLKRWLGPQVDKWRRLRAYAIGHALPRQLSAEWECGPTATAVKGAFVCGDFLETSSIQGALVSGRRAAEALIDYL